MNDSANQPAFFEPDAGERKPYATPAIIELGSVLSLTRGSCGSSNDGPSTLQPAKGGH